MARLNQSRTRRLRQWKELSLIAQTKEAKDALAKLKVGDTVKAA